MGKVAMPSVRRKSVRRHRVKYPKNVTQMGNLDKNYISHRQRFYRIFTHSASVFFQKMGNPLPLFFASWLPVPPTAVAFAACPDIGEVKQFYNTS